MSAWMKLTPIKGKAYCGCGCGARGEFASMASHPHPGFGGVALHRDDDFVDDLGEDATFADYERIAAADPDHDWRLRIDGPLSDYTYQRHGDETWALVRQGPGFA